MGVILGTPLAEPVRPHVGMAHMAPSGMSVDQLQSELTLTRYAKAQQERELELKNALEKAAIYQTEHSKLKQRVQELESIADGTTIVCNICGHDRFDRVAHQKGRWIFRREAVRIRCWRCDAWQTFEPGTVILTGVGDYKARWIA